MLPCHISDERYGMRETMLLLLVLLRGIFILPVMIFRFSYLKEKAESRRGEKQLIDHN